MRPILLTIFLLFLGFSVSLFVKSGAWKSVTVSEADFGPFTMIYKEYSGPYHKILPTIQEVEAWVKSQGLGCTQSFGEYLDDPNVVEHERLRSRGGCLVTQVPEQLPPGIQTQIIPLRHYVVGEFTGSPALGPLKVYGKINQHLEKNRMKITAPILEIYNVTSETEVMTQYLFPIEPSAIAK